MRIGDLEPGGQKDPKLAVPSVSVISETFWDMNAIRSIKPRGFKRCTTPWKTTAETQAWCNYHPSSTRLLRRAGKDGSFWVRISNTKATGAGKSFTLWGLQVMVMVPGVQGQQLFRRALCSAQDHLSLSIGTKWPTRATWLAQPGENSQGFPGDFGRPFYLPDAPETRIVIW